MKSFDVVVIGAGPGGYVAAIRAAQCGLKTAIIEKDKDLGGTCLLRGCIPTKSLLHSADLYEEMQHAADHGIVVKELGFDFAGVQKARTKIVRKSAAGVAYLMKKNKIEVISGYGKLKDKHTIEVEKDGKKELVGAKAIILATGSVPRQIPFAKVDGKHIVTSDELQLFKEPPKSLLVLGAGAVGVEMASVFSRFGTETTIVEMLDRVLPIEDKEVSEELEKVLKKKGIDILVSSKVEKIETKKGHALVSLSTPKGKEEKKFETVLVAVGRAPVTENIGLESVGLQANAKGFIDVNEMMQTSVPNIYAIGDIIPTAQLAHLASAEAMVAVNHFAGRNPHPIIATQVPSCTYCDPEVASVGLSEEAAIAQGYKVKVGKFPFAAIGKARIVGKVDGFVKVVSDARYDEVLGVHMIGVQATNLIAEACAALRLECTTEELAHTIHPHPTLAEAVLEAAHATMGHAVHI
tara:strand:- start:148 stop:1542 length:1395 start_codon:yes stop_codon:yes gene_type:complete